MGNPAVTTARAERSVLVGTPRPRLPDHRRFCLVVLVAHRNAGDEMGNVGHFLAAEFPVLEVGSLSSMPEN